MDAGFKQGMLDFFEQMQRNAVQLHYTPAAEPLAPCRSKIGGRPDVPQDFVWPYFESENYKKVVANRPLSFMAQINLAEAAERGEFYFQLNVPKGCRFSPELRQFLKEHKNTKVKRVER